MEAISKKQIRDNFRNGVFKRDNHKCVMCGKPAVDAHHIIDRHLMVNGSILENGISLCADCHWKAEQFHATGASYPGYSPNELFRKINSQLYHPM